MTEHLLGRLQPDRFIANVAHCTSGKMLASANRSLTMSTSLEQDFHQAMLGIYDAAAKLKPPYRANRFKGLVEVEGGKAAADRLLATTNASEGFTELFLRGNDCLKLSVEYLVLQDQWRSLFTPEQLDIARKRLVAVQCPLPPGA